MRMTAFCKRQIMFDFRCATVFYLAYCLSKHKMFRYSEKSGGHGHLATPMLAQQA